MEISDIQIIWKHIKALRPNLSSDRLPRLTKEVAEAWRTNLEGYTVDQIIRAADVQIAKGPFWPDLSEIMAELPPLPTHLIPGAGAGRGNYKPDPFMDRYREIHRECKQKRRELGVPVNIEEARAQGMSSRELWELWERLGLNVPDDDPELLRLSKRKENVR